MKHFLITIEKTSPETVIISDNSTLVVIIDDDCKYFETINVCICLLATCIQLS